MTAEIKGQYIIDAERDRQIEQEGYSALHDSRYNHNELFLAGMCYYFAEQDRQKGLKGLHQPPAWPWEYEYWKPSPDDRIKELKKAGALFKASYQINACNLSYDCMIRCANDIDLLLSLQSL